jgi:hypothetical protein
MGWTLLLPSQILVVFQTTIQSDEALSTQHKVARRHAGNHFHFWCAAVARDTLAFMVRVVAVVGVAVAALVQV